MSEPALSATQERKRLKEQVDEWRNSPESLLKYLAWSNRFHDYSAFNRALILAQRPDATWCASYNTWVSMGRKPKGKGTSLMIFYPRTIKEEVERNGKTILESRVVGYGKTATFDIKNTVPLDESDTRTSEEIIEELNAPIGNPEQLMAFTHTLSDLVSVNGQVVTFSESAQYIETAPQTTTILELVGLLTYIDALSRGDHPDNVVIGSTRQVNSDSIPTVLMDRKGSHYIPPFRILGTAWAIADRLGVDATKALGLHNSQAVRFGDEETMSETLRFISESVEFIDLIQGGTPVEWAAAMLQHHGVISDDDASGETE